MAETKTGRTTCNCGRSIDMRGILKFIQEYEGYNVSQEKGSMELMKRFMNSGCCRLHIFNIEIQKEINRRMGPRLMSIKQKYYPDPARFLTFEEKTER